MIHRRRGLRCSGASPNRSSVVVTQRPRFRQPSSDEPRSDSWPDHPNRDEADRSSPPRFVRPPGRCPLARPAAGPDPRLGAWRWLSFETTPLLTRRRPRTRNTRARPPNRTWAHVVVHASMKPSSTAATTTGSSIARSDLPVSGRTKLPTRGRRSPPRRLDPTTAFVAPDPHRGRAVSHVGARGRPSR